MSAVILILHCIHYVLMLYHNALSVCPSVCISISRARLTTTVTALKLEGNGGERSTIHIH